MNVNTMLETKYRQQALDLCKGEYQRGIVLGKHSLSGVGKEGARYAKSRTSLLARLKENGIPVREEKGDHGKRILVIGFA